MVRVAIVFLVFAPQAWSLNVSSVADEAPSLLQRAAMDVPVADIEEEVDSVGDGLESPLNQDTDEGLDETQPGADVASLSQLQHLENLHDESTEESHEGLNETQLFAIKPETGDAMPTPPKSFPGCGCNWDDHKTWSCKGIIAHPVSLQGEECCCCTLSCAKDNRCTNEQCLAIGIDQGPEIAAEAARLKAILGDADTVLEGIPAYKVSLGIGRPNGAKIVAVCKAKNMVPLCDSKNYCRSTAVCYHPVCNGNPTKSKLFQHHFSSPTTFATNPIEGIDPSQFWGIAMYMSSNNQPYGGAFFAASMGHSYIAHASTVTTFNLQTKKAIQKFPATQIDQGQALGGWHTMCVKKEATSNVR
jgi:hypothetical protein